MPETGYAIQNVPERLKRSVGPTDCCYGTALTHPLEFFPTKFMVKSQKDLTDEATKLLRTNGYTWSGRERREIDSRQCAFQKRMISTPCGGKPVKKKA